ncbi:MAG: aldehyde dehydrogenase family protein [Candidatus Aminicenantes bacterium]|nr:aldehyde dehydrogenase family protein [Candidatus Aminicenantes bacterium]
MDGRLIIAGQRLATSQTLTSTNPATLEPLGDVYLATEAECARAVAAAHDALPAWRAVSVAEKKRMLFRAQEILLRRSRELAELVTREKGSPISEATTVDVLTGLEMLDYYAHHLEKVRAPRKTKLHIPLFAHKKNAFHFQGLGVTLIISPWNFPFVIPFSDTLSSLVAGNTVVLRPSSTTPFIGLFIGEIFLEAGLPPGVLNVVNSRITQAEAMIVNPVVRTIMFTGSVGIGRRVMELAARNLTHIVLELGGKDPMIVLDDVDLDKAARGAVWNAFMNTGQSCASVERAYVARSLYEAFVAKCLETTKALRIGDPLDPTIDVGPMTTLSQLETVMEQLADARAKGAEVLCGGDRREDLPGYFLRPAVLTKVDHTMKVMTEETFGPVLPIMPFASLEEAVALANDSEYGLTASVWTRDRKKAAWLAERLEAGTVTVNDHMVTFCDPKAIWGGVKKTGVGRSHGPYGLDDISNIKFVSLDFHHRKTQTWWYPYSEVKRGIIENATVLFHDRRFSRRLQALFGLLRRWGTVKAASAWKNIWRVTGRLFRS